MDNINKSRRIFDATYKDNPDAKWGIGKTQNKSKSEMSDVIVNENIGTNSYNDTNTDTITRTKRAPKPEDDGVNGLGEDTVALSGISFTPKSREKMKVSKPYESVDFVTLEENDDDINENSPFSEYPLTDKAGIRNDMYGEPHNHSGINREMPEGTLISLPMDVLFKNSGNHIDHGNWIELEDDSGNILSFQQLKEVGDFNPGDTIKASTPIARSGKNGRRETLREEYYSPEGRNITESYWKNYKKPEEEKEVQPQKDNILEWAYKNSMAGLNQFNKGVFSTLDHYLPTEVLGKYDFVSGLNNYYSDLYDTTKAVADSSSQSRGKGWETAGKVLQEVVSFLPDMVIAIMSMGASTVGSSLTAVGEASIMENVYNIANKASKNPIFWSSFLQNTGNYYEEAKNEGASEFEASAAALTKSLLDSGMAVGSGLEKVPSEIKYGGVDKVLAWVREAAQDGGEAVLQNVLGEAIEKAFYDHDKKLISLTDENALMNPLRDIKDAAYELFLSAGMRIAYKIGKNEWNTTLPERTKENQDMNTAKLSDFVQKQSVIESQPAKKMTNADTPLFVTDYERLLYELAEERRKEREIEEAAKRLFVFEEGEAWGDIGDMEALRAAYFEDKMKKK